MGEQFTPEQMSALQTLAGIFGGVTQKAVQEKKYWHPEMGWLPQSQVPQMKAVGSTPTALLGHGPQGLFSAPALERPVFSAMILPRNGVAANLPVRPSNVYNPLYGIFTGVTADTGSVPNGVCDDPQTAGTSKLCMHTFAFSQRSFQTPVFNILDVGRVHDRGEHFDLQFYGQPFQADSQYSVPTTPVGIDPLRVLNNEQAKAAFELAVTWSRETTAEFWTGNPTNNSTGGGTQYFYGMNILINTGYEDALTGVACPAADSIVQSFGSVDFTAPGAAASIVRTIAAVYQQLAFIADNTGLSPVEWVLAMPPTMFYELVRVYPLQYNTLWNQQLLSGPNTLYVDGAQMAEQRNSMLGDWAGRTGQYLIIDNVRIPVILDDGISSTLAAGGTYTSSMYFIPMTVLGGQQVTYMEYFDWNAPGAAMAFASAFGNTNYYQSSDGGRFLWHFKPPTNWCVQMAAVARMRPILLTPQLAGRITNISWTPGFTNRSWDTTNSSFYVNGGSTSITGAYDPPSYFVPNSGNGT